MARQQQEARIKQLTEMNTDLSEKVARLTNQLIQQPQVLDDRTAQHIMDMRDDVEYFRRRLEEAQIVLNKLLVSLKLSGVDILVAKPPQGQQQ